MDKARTITDTKTLWGEDPDKRNLCSASICLNYSHFIVLSYLPSQFLHFFGLCMDSETALTECSPDAVRLNLFCLNY